MSTCVLLMGVHSVLAAEHSLRDTIPVSDTPVIKLLKGVNVKNKFRNTSLTPQQTLKGEQLQQLNSLSVADAIRYFSGVQLKDYGGIGGLKTINIRSLGTNHTGVFYDGIQLGNAQNGQVDLGRFSLDNIEEVSLFNGQKPVLLQPAKGFSSAGSVYIQSRKPVFTGNQHTLVSAKIKTGSFGLFNPSVFLQQKINRNTGLTVSSEWIHAHGRYRFRYLKKMNGAIVYDTTAVRQNADVDAWRVEAGLNGQLKDSSEWNVKAYFYSSERGLPGAIVNNVFSHGQRQWDRNIFIQSSYKKKISAAHTVLFNAKYADDQTRYLDPDTTNFYTDNRYKQKEFYLSGAWQYSINSYWNIALAIDHQWNKLDADLYRFPFPQRNSTLVSLASSLRLDKFDIQGSLLGTWVNERVKYYTGAGNKKEYTPALAVSWQPFNTPDFIVRSFYKSIFRMPTFNDLYYTFIGNANLLPEYTRQYDLGLQYNRSLTGRLRSISFQADGYLNKVSNKIIAVPTANLFRWTMINLGEVQIKGLDVSLAATLQQRNWIINGKLTYTYQDATDITSVNDVNYGHQIPYIPWHSGSFILSCQYKSWNIHYSTLYTGERYNQKTNIRENHVQPWYTHDLALSKVFRQNNRNFSISTEVNNVFNQQYDVVLNYPMPGRNYKLILGINF